MCSMVTLDNINCAPSVAVLQRTNPISFVNRTYSPLRSNNIPDKTFIIQKYFFMIFLIYFFLYKKIKRGNFFMKKHKKGVAKKIGNPISVLLVKNTIISSSLEHFS